VLQCIADPYKQNEAVIDALHRRPDEDFDSFCDALILTKQAHIVDSYLRPNSQTSTTNAAPEGKLPISVVHLSFVKVTV